MKILKIIKIIFFSIIGLFILLIIAWQVDRHFWHPKDLDPSEIFTNKIDIPKDQASCEVQGGTWKKIGIRPIEECNLPTNDSGQNCKDNSECQGKCVVNLSYEQLREKMKKGAFRAEGQCSQWVKTVGCKAYVINGWAHVICSD